MFEMVGCCLEFVTAFIEWNLSYNSAVLNYFLYNTKLSGELNISQQYMNKLVCFYIAWA